MIGSFALLMVMQSCTDLTGLCNPAATHLCGCLCNSRISGAAQLRHKAMQACRDEVILRHLQS